MSVSLTLTLIYPGQLRIRVAVITAFVADEVNSLRESSSRVSPEGELRFVAPSVGCQNQNLITRLDLSLCG